MFREKNLIRIGQGDDKDFIKLVNLVMAGVTVHYSVNEVVHVKIKNWFDHKWLNYSGKSIVPFEGGLLGPHSSFDNVWREKTCIPPFNPNRVLSSMYFYMEYTGNTKIERVIHRRRSTTDNLHNRIVDYFTDGLAIWFSSNTVANQRGSIMVYRVQNKRVHSWYASFEKKTVWQIMKTKGIAKEALRTNLNGYGAEVDERFKISVSLTE